MTGMIRNQLTGLAGTITDLKERVRVAVASELGRAVSSVVQQVVQAVVAGRPDPARPEPPSAARHHAHGRWDEDEDDRWHRDRDPWADEREDYRDRHPPAPARAETIPTKTTDHYPAVTTAVVAGVYVARLWLVRRGTVLAAVGVGLGVGLLGVVGGPMARTAVAVLAATADMLAVTDALGDGAARLEYL